MNKKVRPFLLLALPIVLSVGLSYILQIFILRNQAQFTDWLAGFGPMVVLVYIILQAITVIIAPLGGFFMVVAMIALFGPGIALTLAYFIWTPCYIINFYLARKYGRPLVQKILGKASIEKLDDFVKDEGFIALILTRVLQAGNFDYFSYAWGLTKISFRTFTIVNIIGGIPAMYLMYLTIAHFKSLTYGIIAFYIMTTLLTATAILLHRTYRKNLKPK